MDADARLRLAERILERSPADATEVAIIAGRRALTRFTHESIHQNVDVSDVGIRVRAIVDGRTGVASTNATDESALAATLARAAEIAGFAPREADLPPLAGPAAVEVPAGACVAPEAVDDAALRTRIAGSVFAHAERHGYWSAGYVTAATTGVTIATSAGARMSFDGTDAGVNAKLTAPDSTGFAEQYGSDANALDGEAIGARAASKAAASANPTSVEPGSWTVILEPAAFGELVVFLREHFSAKSYLEGSSVFSGSLGAKIAGSNVTIRDDYAHPLHPDMPFDWEGVPRQAVTLIERGIAQNVVTDAHWAAKLGRPNTGHGLPAPNAYGPLPLDLVVDAGTQSLDELIAGTERGLLITRLWYVRNVDARKTIVTGMTRDGTFLVEGGKLTRGVRNLRFNQSLIEALGSATFGCELQRTGGYAYSMVVPAVKFDHFTFASTTDY